MPPPQGNTKVFHLDGLTHPSRGNVELEVCTLNRNPADFSIPDAKNEYTICARDLKLRKKKSLKERSRAVNLERLKRARKDAQEKCVQETSRQLFQAYALFLCHLLILLMLSARLCF